MAGVVDVLSDRLAMHCKSPYALEADIFHVKDNDISLLHDAVKERLHTPMKKGNIAYHLEMWTGSAFSLKRERPMITTECFMGRLHPGVRRINCPRM